jgi:predicted dienelactone hydrolase
MHPLDLVLFALLLFWPIARAFGWQRLRPVPIAVAAAIVLWLASYLALELFRWPILPALLLLVAWEVQVVGVLVGEVGPLSPDRGTRVVPLALALALAAPVIVLPAWILPRTAAFIPSGPFMAGVVDVTWVDSSRVGATGGPYLLPVRLWYPAERVSRPVRADRHRAMDWFEADLAQLLPGRRGPWIVRGLTRAPLPISADGRLATRQRDYPVVILSHGVPGSPALLATLAAELASQGIVVATPEHLGGSLGSILPGEGHRPPVVSSLDVDPIGGEWGMLAAADGRAVLSWLREIVVADSANRFTGRLRLDAVGWVGQGSGAPAGEILAAEGLVAALIFLDPVAAGPGDGAAVPVLRFDRGGTSLPARLADGVVAVEVPEAGSADFTDLSTWSPFLLRRAGLGGRVDAIAVRRGIHALAVAFLSAHLRHEPANLRGLADSLPGVRLRGAYPPD